MPLKIIDQFTDLPVSPSTKWRLRHPGEDKARQRADYLKLQADPEKFARRVASMEQATKRSNGKKAIARVVKRRDWRHATLKRDQLVSEAKRHQVKGRTIGDICVWMNLPESKVRELLA